MKSKEVKKTGTSSKVNQARLKLARGAKKSSSIETAVALDRGWIPKLSSTAVAFIRDEIRPCSSKASPHGRSTDTAAKVYDQQVWTPGDIYRFANSPESSGFEGLVISGEKSDRLNR